MDDARRSAVAAMLGARSVALVGASARPESLGARMIIEGERGSATVHLVNPRYGRIGERPCAPSLLDLDEPPDLALLAVPDSALMEQLEAAAAAGVRGAVLFGAAHGLREKIAETATAAGMALCGAGCMGFVNNVLGVRALGYLEPNPLPPGGISLVTHSGSAFSTLLRARRGFGYRLAVSSGQELVTDAADYLEYALDDAGTDVVALLMETPRDVPRLRRALLRAADSAVPVVILPVGGSPRGRQMVAAHSGALAGEAAGWQALCAATGAIRVNDLAELTDTLELFSTGRRATGKGLATVHDSGAERALLVDLADELDVPFADLGSETLGALVDLLDDGLAATNPLDVWGTGADTRALFRACLRAMAEDPAVGVTALAVDLVQEYDGDTAYTDAILDVVTQTTAPLAVLASVPSAVDAVAAKRLRDNGVPVLEGARSGLAAIGHLLRWPLAVVQDLPDIDQGRRQRWLARLDTWNAAAGYALLADYGIPVARPTVARSLTEVLAAARDIGYPVAMKTLAVEHKSDVGGVLLGIADGDALRSAYTEISARLGRDVTVQPMIADGVEVSIGIVRDAAFGPLLVLAAGGTLVELLADRVVALPPVTADSARTLLDGMRIRPLLDGWRGAAAADLAALGDAVAAFAVLAVELGDAVDAVEANPVIVSSAGVVAVDALVYPRNQKIE